MADIMKKMSGMGMRDRMKAVQDLQRGGLLNPGARIGRDRGNTGKRLSSQEKARLRKQREKDARRRKREDKRKRFGGGDGRAVSET
jgi:signal recognition particle subunit SRP54